MRTASPSHSDESKTRMVKRRWILIVYFLGCKKYVASPGQNVHGLRKILLCRIARSESSCLACKRLPGQRDMGKRSTGKRPASSDLLLLINEVPTPVCCQHCSFDWVQKGLLFAKLMSYSIGAEPPCTKRSSHYWPRLSPSARLYSVEPRSSQCPSMVNRTLACCFKNRCLLAERLLSGADVELSYSEKISFTSLRKQLFLRGGAVGAGGAACVHSDRAVASCVPPGPFAVNGRLLTRPASLACEHWVATAPMPSMLMSWHSCLPCQRGCPALSTVFGLALSEAVGAAAAWWGGGAAPPSSAGPQRHDGRSKANTSMIQFKLFCFNFPSCVIVPPGFRAAFRVQARRI